MQYTWNDIMDPNPQYASDMKKSAFAKLIPYANPTDYNISITWHDISAVYFPQLSSKVSLPMAKQPLTLGWLSDSAGN